MRDVTNKEIYVDQVLVGSEIRDEAGKSVLVHRVATFANLPATGVDGDMYLVLDEDTFYEWDSPTSSYVVPAATSKGFTSGCRLVWGSATQVYVGSGVVDILGTVVSKSTDLLVTWSSMDTGSTKKANTWYYVYVQVASDRRTFTAFVSEQVPTKNQYGGTLTSPSTIGAKYHPTRSARFVGSFKTDASQNVYRFRVIGSYVSYIGLGSNYILSSGNGRVRTAVNCRGFVPYTSDLLQLYYELSAGSNVRNVGDSSSWYIVATAGAGVIILPVTSDSVYYMCSGTNTVSLGIFGYYEDI